MVDLYPSMVQQFIQYNDLNKIDIEVLTDLHFLGIKVIDTNSEKYDKIKIALPATVDFNIFSEIVDKVGFWGIKNKNIVSKDKSTICMEIELA